MNGSHWVTGTVCAAALLVAGFRPFTPVKDVCPSCRALPGDRVVLLSGAAIPCHVIAQNDDFYVIEWFGEDRAVAKNQIGALEWEENKPRDIPRGDQILLKNDIVLHGTILEVPKEGFGYFVIQVGDQKHFAWSPAITSVYRDGKSFTAF